MERETNIPEYRVRLTDNQIAKLLGISISEYTKLSHLPLQAFTDLEGNVTEFYIHVSTNNDPELLSKLNLDKNNFVRFKPEEIYSKYA